MTNLRSLAATLCFFAYAGALVAQAPAKVDFATDVMPLLRQNCVGCHGPKKQNGGMRLDRRSSAMKARRITPGSPENSFVYHRVIGEFGQTMPPTGDLKPEQVAVLKNWIEQGAVWPDEYANEIDLPPISKEAAAMVEELRTGAMTAFLKTAEAKPGLLNARGPEGSTPFIYAVLYARTATLARLLKLGADPNKKNDANASALMWAARDLEKTRLLVEHGADVNAVSDDFRSALMIAARQPDGAATVKLLLEHGANPNPNAHPEGASSPLLEAATAGNVESMALLFEHGAKLKGDAQGVLSLAAFADCPKCVDLAVLKIKDKDVYTGSLQDVAVLGDTRTVRLMLEHGADAKAYDPIGRTALMYAAQSDILPLETVKLLVAHGADVNAKSKHPNGGDTGVSVLDMSERHGKNAVSDFLVASGAKGLPVMTATFNPRFKNEIRSAIQDSLPHLQRADAVFTAKSGCVSCHDNSLTAMTVAMARKQGFRVDEKTAAAQVKVNVDMLAKTRDILHQDFLIPAGDNFSEGVEAYVLIGLNAEGYKADLDTDAAAMHILSRQRPNGEWQAPIADTRQPLCLEHVGDTALSLRALQLYAPKVDAAAYRRAVQKAGVWLAQATSYSNDDRSWRVAGLAWAGTDKVATRKAVRELVGTQKADGGWSDLPSMESTAYATGKSLVALHLAGVAATDPAYKRGVAWLLKNQQKDGTWYVQTRAMGFQPTFDAGFPHGNSQWISSAGTNWAAMALTLALPKIGGGGVARAR